MSLSAAVYSGQSTRTGRPDRFVLWLLQVEFYFSDSNLPKDKFLKEQVDKHPNGCEWRRGAVRVPTRCRRRQAAAAGHAQRASSSGCPHQHAEGCGCECGIIHTFVAAWYLLPTPWGGAALIDPWQHHGPRQRLANGPIPTPASAPASTPDVDLSLIMSFARMRALLKVGGGALQRAQSVDDGSASGRRRCAAGMRAVARAHAISTGCTCWHACWGSWVSWHQRKNNYLARPHASATPMPIRAVFLRQHRTLPVLGTRGARSVRLAMRPT